MGQFNVTAAHAESVIGDSGASGGSLAASAALTSGTAVGNTANTLISTYFYYAPLNFYYNYRAYMSFDLSSSEGICTAVDLILFRRTSFTVPEQYIVAAEASDAVATSDYLDGITGQDGYPFTDDATQYTDSAWNPNSDGGSDGSKVTITLNAAAVSAINTAMGSGKFKLAMINTYDFNNTYASSGITNGLAVQGVYFSSTQHGTSGLHPQVKITTLDPAAGPNTEFTKVKGGNLKLKSGNLKI